MGTVAEANGDEGHVEVKQWVHGKYVAEMGEDDIAEMMGGDNDDDKDGVAEMMQEEGNGNRNGNANANANANANTRKGSSQGPGKRQSSSMKRQELIGEGGVYELGTGRRSVVVRVSTKADRLLGL